MANILTLESFMHVNGLQIQHSSEWEDYLEMQAQAAGMTKEEWIAYYGPSAHLSESKKVTRKQLDKAIDGLNSAIKELTLVLPKWQEARDKGDDQAQATYLEELRELTQKKQAAEKLVNQHIKDLDKNAKLKITAESLREDGIVVTEGFTSKLNQIRQRAKSAGDFIKKTLSDAEFKMFNGNKKFELFLTDFYAVASESAQIDEKRGYDFFLNVGVESYVYKILGHPDMSKEEKIKALKDMTSGNDYAKATRDQKKGIKKAIEYVTNESVNEGKKYKAKELNNLWYGVYGEPLSNYSSFLSELEYNYRRGISKEEIANLWDKHYGEDMEQDYSGFYDKLEESVNEGVFTIAGGVVLGILGSIFAYKGLRAAKNIGGAIVDNGINSLMQYKRKLEDEEEFKTKIKPVADRFAKDRKLADMYDELPSYLDSWSDEATQQNKERTKALKDIAKYIKSKLSKEEEMYFKEISELLRTGRARVGRNIFNESVNEFGPMTGSGNRRYRTRDIVNRIGDLDNILMYNRKTEREWEEMSQNYLDGEKGSEYWGDLEDQELQNAIKDAEYLMKKYRIRESVNEDTEVTKEMWDKEWNIKKAFGKDFERAYGLRVQAAMSKAKDEEQAEEWAYKNFKQLPNPAKGMTIEESVMNEANMKHILTLESFLNEKTKFDPPVNHKSSDLKKQGAEWWFTVPFAEMKSRALGKTNFMTSDNVSDLDSEIWWTRQAFNHDGRAHAKILKMLAKHKGDYKGAGDRWEQYQEWIEQAMVGQGTMIQM